MPGHTACSTAVPVLLVLRNNYCCGSLSGTGRRDRKVFPVWPSKEIWDEPF